jgi:hypothetical protein
LRFLRATLRRHGLGNKPVDLGEMIPPERRRPAGQPLKLRVASRRVY